MASAPGMESGEEAVAQEESCDQNEPAATEPTSNGLATSELTEAIDVDNSASSASSHAKSELIADKAPARELSMVDEIMNMIDGKTSEAKPKKAVEQQEVKESKPDVTDNKTEGTTQKPVVEKKPEVKASSTTSGPTLRSTTNRSTATGSSNRKTICATPSPPVTSSRAKFTRSTSVETTSPPIAAKPKVVSPTTAPKPKVKAHSVKLPSYTPKEPDEPITKVRKPSGSIVPREPDEPITKARKPSGSIAPSASAEPEIKKLPDVETAPVLKHLGKERPRRVKNKVTRRPMPAAAVDVADLETVEDFFKPATVSQTPVIVTAPTAKPRSGSKPEKPDSRPKVEKLDDSPKLKHKPKPTGSNKEKVDEDKKRGGLLASGISGFFKKKKEKTVDAPDSKSSGPTTVAVTKAEAAAPTPKSRTASVDIPETPIKVNKQETQDEKPLVVEPSAEVNKSASLERSSTSDAMSTSAVSTSEAEGAPVPAPKKRQVGVGLPGMSSGLLAEMQSKRTAKQLSQPKALPRAGSKAEENSSPMSPPARPQPPVMKSSPSIQSEVSKEATSPSTPPARPTPPMPKAAPRDAIPSATTPAKPPVLRPKPPPKMPKPAKPARPATVIDMPATRPVSAKTGGSLKISASQGDLTDDRSSNGEQEIPAKRDTGGSGSARDSIAEELSLRLREGKRHSSVRLSNGSATQDKRLSSPVTPQSAHLEDGPVLQPPTTTKRQTSEETKPIGTDRESCDDSVA